VFSLKVKVEHACARHTLRHQKRRRKQTKSEAKEAMALQISQRIIKDLQKEVSGGAGPLLFTLVALGSSPSVLWILILRWQRAIRSIDQTHFCLKRDSMRLWGHRWMTLCWIAAISSRWGGWRRYAGGSGVLAASASVSGREHSKPYEQTRQTLQDQRPVEDTLHTSGLPQVNPVGLQCVSRPTRLWLYGAPSAQLKPLD
jgi:hypothetical protein